MIILTDKSKKKNRVIQGVQFVKGKAVLQDNMRAKADAISKYYNVDIELTFEPESEGAMPGDGVAGDVAISPSPVGAESAEVPDEDVKDEVKTDEKVNTWAAADTKKEEKTEPKK